ncbi:M-phase inducer phosphatase-like [Sitophilus oryzae]|uniref:protein-tyrosine-phosphatase n=1 Tax=Sitophilus oryzae TaxID=7048 RepID=A0A6J2X930_SITOR|nr:M-phase inducer phosphatase-like [Sitophilus oryzae]
MCEHGAGFFPEKLKEVSLFDADTKDSGFCEEPPSDFELLADSPLRDETAENSILCFSLASADDEDSTPNRDHIFGKKKRLFRTPDNTASPTCDTVVNLKRLKLFDGVCDDSEPEFLDNFTPRKKIKCNEIDLKTPSELIYQEEKVKEAVEKSESDSDLIGDFSKPYILPLITGSHPDLKSISSLTMSNVIRGKYTPMLNSFLIIDCRYPYEYNGGHIEGAINIYTQEQCLKLLHKPVKQAGGRHILIFHCEFSMERGPSMSRLLRKEDRLMNSSNYPNLVYPEIYILEGGYKTFFHSFPELCVPKNYKQMLHPDHADDFRYFRKKSKSSDVIKNSKKNPPSKKIRRFLSENLF